MRTALKAFWKPRQTPLTTSHLPTFPASKNLKLSFTETSHPAHSLQCPFEDVHFRSPSSLPPSMNVLVPPTGSHWHSSAVTHWHAINLQHPFIHLFATGHSLYQRNKFLDSQRLHFSQYIKQNSIKRGTSTYQEVRRQKTITGGLYSQVHPLSLSLSASPDEVLILSSVLCYSYF